MNRIKLNIPSSVDADELGIDGLRLKQEVEKLEPKFQR